MSFDRIAPCCDALELITAGPLLQRARTWWFEAVADRRRVLSAGEGHGKFATAFARRFPDAAIACVDASAGMLKVARRRARHLEARIEWWHGTLPAWRPPNAASFDLIATCFFLDCFTPAELEAIVAGLASIATPDAAWLVVDFAVPERGPARWRALAIHQAMYRFFRATTALTASRLTAPDPWLRSAGFHLVARREWSWGLLRADLWRRRRTTAHLT